MTLTNFLKQDGIDIYDSGNPYGNLIKQSLNDAKLIKFDFERNIIDLTDDEIYYIFKPLILYFNKPRPYFVVQIVEIMKNEFNKSLNN